MLQNVDGFSSCDLADSFGVLEGSDDVGVAVDVVFSEGLASSVDHALLDHIIQLNRKNLSGNLQKISVKNLKKKWMKKADDVHNIAVDGFVVSGSYC